MWTQAVPTRQHTGTGSLLPPCCEERTHTTELSRKHKRSHCYIPRNPILPSDPKCVTAGRWHIVSILDTFYTWEMCMGFRNKNVIPRSKISSQIMRISLEMSVLNVPDHLGFAPENNLFWIIYNTEQTHVKLLMRMNTDTCTDTVANSAVKVHVFS